MGDISHVYRNIMLRDFELMICNSNKHADRVHINTAEWVSKLKFNDMKTRYDNFIKKEGKKPNWVSINLGSTNMVRTYTENALASKAIDIIAETKRIGKNPDRIHIRNRENNNLDVLSKPQYMGLYENRNVFWRNNQRFPNWTTLNSIANNPVVMNFQSNSVNCGPMSLSMISQQLFKNTRESEFVKVCKTDKNGTDPKNLHLISKLGFKIVQIPRTANAVKKALDRGNGVMAHYETGPTKSCLGFIQNYGHYGVINRVTNTQYLMLDPTKGVRWCNHSIVDRATNGRNIHYYEVSVA